MTTCEHLSERMPEVARARASWSRADQAHLAACPACQAEWELVRIAATHGTTVAMQVDVARLIGQVEHRLRHEPVPAPVATPSFGWRVWPIAIAAGLSLMIFGGPERQAAPSAAPTTVVAVLHELDDLTVTELESILEQVPEATTPEYRSLDTPESLSDLSAEELEQLLSSMEG